MKELPLALIAVAAIVLLVAPDHAIAAVPTSGEASSKDKFPEPPAVYVDKGACPGECCVFRSWSVLKDAALLDKPDGTHVVSVVKKGEWVKGLTV